MPRHKSRSRKRKFQGNRFTSRESKVTPSCASASKINVTKNFDSIDTDNYNIIINFGTFKSFLQNFYRVRNAKMAM